MAYAISLHIGLNKIDKKHYGSEYPLAGCINDAKDMLAIARQKQYDESYILIDEAGTYKNITEHLTAAAKKLKKGDTFFITYSGHGAYVPDKNKDELDGKDETWCLYDRMILDDDLALYWSKFKPGVRIFMVSDSCHSGTVSRAMRSNGTLDDSLEALPDRLIKEGPKIFARHKSLYNNASSTNADISKSNIKASIILLSGCQDNQTSLDGDKNGLFTEKMLKVYKKGKFTGNYAQMLKEILKLMPSNQTPNYYLSGKRDIAFESSRPFEK